MIADLKAKAEGFDKKRVYTAVAALVIAGAAGHIMQRGASASDDTRVLTASVPGTPQAAAPVRAPQVARAPAVAAAAFTPKAPPKPATQPATAPVMAAAEPAPAEATPAPAIDLAATVVEPTVPVSADPEIAPIETASEPAESLPDMEIAVADPTPPEPAAPADMALEQVTRAAPKPILALGEGAPEADPADDMTLAAAEAEPDIEAAPAAPLPDCEIAFDAAPVDGALVALSFAAPCNAGEKVEFHQAGLKFSEQLGPNGALYLIVPAMEETAVFTADLEAGQQVAAEVTLPDFADYERVALVWKGATGLQLHALENGADYGEPGHVWAEAPASPDAAKAGTGGFVSVLGSTGDGYAADVYTYPAALMVDGVEPIVSVEAQVMENTCGNRISGEILRSNAGRAPTDEPLTMAVPGCDAVGEYLVLNNLPQDLKLARN